MKRVHTAVALSFALLGCRDIAAPPPAASADAAALTAPAPSSLAHSSPALDASEPAARPVASTPSATKPAALAPVEPTRLRVPGDLPASIVSSADGAAPTTVFLPGICSNAYAYLLGFPNAAAAHGGVIALDGDGPCGDDPAFRTFTSNPELQHRRIEAALAAAGLTEIPPKGITLIGYSRGATIAEKLALRWPERYTRVVLIGSPVDPSPTFLSKTRAVVTMSCSLDVPPRMREGANRIDRSGVPAKYFEMPGCTHGNITDGEHVFAETFDWLAAHQRSAQVPALATPIVGGLDE